MAKAIIFFYSYSGNTKKVTKILQEQLSGKYNTDSVQIEAFDEPNSFFKQCVRAVRKKEAKINEDIASDLKEYDLIALGTPVWAFGMAPGLRTFINKCSGLDSKKIILFATYGSGVGKDKCLNEMEEIVKDKGAKDIKRFLVQQHDVLNADLVKGKIEGLF